MPEMLALPREGHNKQCEQGQAALVRSVQVAPQARASGALESVQVVLMTGARGAGCLTSASGAG